MQILESLLNSRKFWLAFLALAAAVVMFIQGAITADQLVDAILVLVGIVSSGIAIEDGAEKFGAEKFGRNK